MVRLFHFYHQTTSVVMSHRCWHWYKSGKLDSCVFLPQTTCSIVFIIPFFVREMRALWLERQARRHQLWVRVSASGSCNVSIQTLTSEVSFWVNIWWRLFLTMTIHEVTWTRDPPVLTAMCSGTGCLSTIMKSYPPAGSLKCKVWMWGFESKCLTDKKLLKACGQSVNSAQNVPLYVLG